MNMAAKIRPDIAYEVHQAAEFSHKPKNSHAIAIKRILQILKKAQDKGLFMRQIGHSSCLVILIQTLEGYLGLKILHI